MWQRFTEQSRNIVLASQQEAEQMNSRHVGTEHLLLALLGDGESPTTTALSHLGLTADTVRQQIKPSNPRRFELSPAKIEELSARFGVPDTLTRDLEEHVRSALLDQMNRHEPKLSPSAKRVLERARGEARHLKHRWIVPEHLLLGLLPRKNDSIFELLHTLRVLPPPTENIASNILHQLGVSPQQLRLTVRSQLSA